MTDRRMQIAERAYRFIEDEVRPHLRRGGNLHTKGSNGYPGKLRRMLAGLDKTPPTHVSLAAKAADLENCQIEHVIPWKRIIVELVDPAACDDRINTSKQPIAGGPASSPQQLLHIFDQLAKEKCWVTKDEHRRLNTVIPSSQWDAPDGDGWKRYGLAGIEVIPLSS